VVEEVVETEAITLATADGQIVRVISKEQYDRWWAIEPTYFCFLSSLLLFPPATTAVFGSYLSSLYS
jgi:hypothetical protein